MNLGELKSETFRRLNESSTAPVFWTAADVTASLNEGYLDFCERTKLVSREADVECVRGVPYVDMRAWRYPFLGLRRVFSRTINKPLPFANVAHVDTLENRWEMSSGNVQRVFMRGAYTLGFWPVPQVGEVFRVTWTSMPDAMAYDYEQPEIPSEFHEALLFYAIYDLRAQEPETALALEAYGSYQQMVERGVLMARSLIQSPRTWVMGESRVY